MQGRGLAAAWGLLLVLVAGVVAWLALSEHPDQVTAAPPVVTVEIPAFPPAPAEEPRPEQAAAQVVEAQAPSPTGSRLAAARQGQERPPAVETPQSEVPAAPSAVPDTAPGEQSRAEASFQEIPAPEVSEPDTERQAETPLILPDPIPEPINQVEQAGATQQEPERQLLSESGAEPGPPMPIPPAPERTETREHAQDERETAGPTPSDAAVAETTSADPAPTAAPQRLATAPERPAAESPSTPADATRAPADPGAEPKPEPLPPTVEVGVLRPIPDAALRPLKPPEAPRPDPALTEQGPFGPLPAVAPDGRRAWKAYSRPFSAAPQTSRVAIVIGNLGLANAITERAINELPPEVTLSFAPYAENVDSWIAKARAAGHEAMLDLPMEPLDYPKNDPGPKALFTHLETQQNIRRLQWVLSRAVGYVGVTNFMGSRFTTAPEALRPILEALRDRGLMFLDSRSAARSLATTMASEIDLPRAVNDRFLDVKASRAAIDRRLRELEEIAKSQGAAVGIGYPYPVTIDRVIRWAKELEGRNDIELAPISALVGRQADR